MTHRSFGKFRLGSPIMERETGFEPATSSLGSWHSTPELLPLQSYGRIANNRSRQIPFTICSLRHSVKSKVYVAALAAVLDDIDGKTMRVATGKWG